MRLLFAIALLMVLVSVACTPLKSASQSAANNATPAQNQSTGADAAQSTSNCTLALSSAPSINGLSLGMTRQQLLALFPGDKEHAETRVSAPASTARFAMSSIDVTPVESTEHFNGINHVSVRLVDDRVYSLRISYNGPAWSHVDKFVEKFVQGTVLPPASQWEAYVGMDNQLKTLRCSGFTVQVFAGGPGGSLNYAEITDVAADKELKDRRAKARAQATSTP